ncbi:hypothetical protein R1sor_005657 [Riccia sorocarpa]|uniref:Uncharacterized protein n=1 Tax=Riccia sorocarpa TaxID=122646 RepID=A0ABD3HPF8_9MARC
MQTVPKQLPGPPAWLHRFVETEDFLVGCNCNLCHLTSSRRAGSDPESTCSQCRRYFCTECPMEGAICLGRVMESHLKHSTLRVRKMPGVEWPAVRVGDIDSLVNISQVLRHSMANGKKEAADTAFIQIRSHKDPVWGLGYKSAGGKPPCFGCLKLSRSEDGRKYKYCCLQCAYPGAAAVTPAVAPSSMTLQVQQPTGYMRYLGFRSTTPVSFPAIEASPQDKPTSVLKPFCQKKDYVAVSETRKPRFQFRSCLVVDLSAFRRFKKRVFRKLQCSRPTLITGTGRDWEKEPTKSSLKLNSSRLEEDRFAISVSTNGGKSGGPESESTFKTSDAESNFLSPSSPSPFSADFSPKVSIVTSRNKITPVSGSRHVNDFDVIPRRPSATIFWCSEEGGYSSDEEQQSRRGAERGYILRSMKMTYTSFRTHGGKAGQDSSYVDGDKTEDCCPDPEEVRARWEGIRNGALNRRMKTSFAISRTKSRRQSTSSAETAEVYGREEPTASNRGTRSRSFKRTSSKRQLEGRTKRSDGGYKTGNLCDAA